MSIVGEIKRQINKRRWEKWRRGHCRVREKTYFHCWSDCSYTYSLGPYIDFYIKYYRDGQSNCYEGSGSWRIADCLPNAMMRFARAGKSYEFYDVLSKCYWKEKEGCLEHCYMEDYGRNKPIYIAAIVNNSLTFSHAVCAEFLGGDKREFTNWKFFQYDDLEIHPGEWQMPCGTDVENTKIRIKEVKTVWTCGGSFSGPSVVCFEIDKNCQVLLSGNCP